MLTAICLKLKVSSVFICLTFAAAGALLLQIENQTLPENRIKKIYDENRIASDAPVEIEGVISGKIEPAAGGFFMTLEVESLTFSNKTRTVSGAVGLFAAITDDEHAAEYANLDLRHGSKIRVFCRLQREDNFLNPGVISQKELSNQKGIDASAIIKSPLLVEKIADESGFSPLGWIYEQRQKLIEQFRRKFGVSTAGVLIASLLGDENFLDKPTADVFREGGTFHVLVISGLHITFIGWLILSFLRFLTRKKIWHFVFTTAFLWSYALAVGAETPVVRAALMFTILLFSQIVYRSGTLLNALGACGLILLVRQPHDLFTASFQLTFVSVGAIVAAAFPLIENLRKIGEWSPSADEPFPPDVPLWLKKVCETLYWRGEVWEIERKRQIWSAKLFKSPRRLIFKAVNFQKIAAFVVEAMLVSLIAQICLLPLMIFYFHRVSFAAIFLNLWVEIFIALETFAALAAVCFAQLSDVLALPLIALTEFFNRLLVGFPGFLTGHNWASFRLPAYSGWTASVYAVYFAPVIFLIFALNYWKPFDLFGRFHRVNLKSGRWFSIISLLILAAVVIFNPGGAARADGKLRVDFLDVGQGDSALLTFPNGETMLIDGGGKVNFNQKLVKNEMNDEPEMFAPDSATIGESVVSPFLWSRGLDQIDYILASHADTDHIQGLTAVAKNFRVQTAFFGRTPLKDPDFAELDEVLQKRGIPLVKLSRGDVLNIGEVRIEVLSPEADDSPDAVSNNNHSLVLRVIYGNKKFLFTGDIERETENALLENPRSLQADFVKVAHHGSHTSSTQNFIDASKAEYAVISVGRRSQFGHPHTDVLERWKNAGAKIYRTGERGTISVTTDGKNLEIQTFVR